MFSKKSFTLLVACGTTPFFAFVSIIYVTDCGKHWFFLAIERMNEGVFYFFNNYGIKNTLDTLGCLPNKLNKQRREVLHKLSAEVWKKTSISCVSFIGYNGLHQDFSTDECGYHVFRFVYYMYQFVFVSQTEEITKWTDLLQHYLVKFGVNLVSYDDKYLYKSFAQSILLQNDRELRRFAENKSLVHTDNWIQEHDEYTLTEKQWSSYSKKYIEAKNKASLCRNAV